MFRKTDTSQAMRDFDSEARPQYQKSAPHPSAGQTATGAWGGRGPGGLMENTGADRHSFSADVMLFM